jgi:hypothetical protein
MQTDSRLLTARNDSGKRETIDRLPPQSNLPGDQPLHCIMSILLEFFKYLGMPQAVESQLFDRA